MSCLRSHKKEYNVLLTEETDQVNQYKITYCQYNLYESKNVTVEWKIYIYSTGNDFLKDLLCCDLLKDRVTYLLKIRYDKFRFVSFTIHLKIKSSA